MLKQLLILFTLCASRPLSAANNELAQPISEETKHLAVRCFSAALPIGFDDDERPEAEESSLHQKELASLFRDPLFAPTLAQSITLLLDIARTVDSLQLRLDALQTLAQLLLKNVQEVYIIANYFPGIVSALCRIIWQKKEKENHQILATAVGVLGDIICTVMRDEINQECLQDVRSFQDLRHIMISRNTTESKSREPSSSSSNTTSNEDRARNWLASAKEKIRQQLNKILSIRSHPDWRVRLAYVDFAYKLLANCSGVLENCIAPLLETLILHIDDEYSQVATTSRMRVQELMKKPAFEESMVPNSKVSLYDCIMSLPEHLITGSEEKKLDAIRLLTGYVLLLKEHAKSVLDTTIGRISEAWLNALEIDPRGLNILEQQDHGKYVELQEESQPTPSSPVYPKVRFRYLVSDQSVAQISRMLNVIGRYGNLPYWLEHFMGYLRAEEEEMTEDAQPQAAFVVHALLAGAATAQTDEVAEWVLVEEERLTNRQLKTLSLQVLHDLMNDIIDPVKTATQSSSLIPGRTMTQANPEVEGSQVLCICYSLQIIGLLACILEREYLQSELITILYPLLAHLGSSNLYIHNYALITLDAIALVCGHPGAKELSIANVDYIINMVSQRITALADNLKAPLVLKALVKIGGLTAVEYLDDTIEEVFDALDRYHFDGWSCAQLCSVLTEIVKTIQASLCVADDYHHEDDEDKDAVAAAAAAADEIKRKATEQQVSPEILEFAASLEAAETPEEEKETATMEEIGRYFLERQKAKRDEKLDLQEMLQRDIKDADADDEKEPPAEEETPLTRMQQMTLDIMEKARHFLTAPSPHLRVEMLILFAAGVRVLGSREEKTGPLIHATWPLLVKRLQDEEHAVLFSALALMIALVEQLGDFMLRRVEDIWPRLRALLRQGASKNPYYSTFSYMHRLHAYVLRTLSEIARHVPLRAVMVSSILDEAKRFLDDRMNPELQKEALDLYMTASRTHPDVVWLLSFAMLGDDAKLEPKHESLKTFQVPPWFASKNSHFARNARYLLESIP